MNVQIEESWKQHLAPEFEKDYFIRLTEFVRSEYQTATLYPFQVIGSPDIRISSFSFRPEALEGFDKNPMYKNHYCYGNNLRHITAPKGFSLKYIITYYQAYQDVYKRQLCFKNLLIQSCGYTQYDEHGYLIFDCVSPVSYTHLYAG